MILSPNDMHVYEVLARLAPFASSYLGIGIQAGECVRTVVVANPLISRLVLCDTWGLHLGSIGHTNHDHVEEKLRDAGYRGEIEYLDGPSQHLVPLLEEQFDLAYVDGDHNVEPAFDDMSNTWPLVIKAMVVHDVFMPTTAIALQKFIATVPDVKMVIHSGGTGTAVFYR